MIDTLPGTLPPGTWVAPFNSAEYPAYGLVESLQQSDECPQRLQETGVVKVEVAFASPKPPMYSLPPICPDCHTHVCPDCGKCYEPDCEARGCSCGLKNSKGAVHAEVQRESERVARASIVKMEEQKLQERCSELAQKLLDADELHLADESTIYQLNGAARADTQRLIDAAAKAGIVYVGCDTPDALADAVLEAHARLAVGEKILRECANALRDNLRMWAYKNEPIMATALEKIDAFFGQSDTEQKTPK